MNIFKKPKNKWGWVRVSGCVMLVFVGVWMMLAAVLRSMAEIPWMEWSGYQTFSLLNGFELAVIPLLIVIVSRWLEEENLKMENLLSNYRETEQAVAAQREKILKRVHEAIPDVKVATDISEPVRLKIFKIVQAALLELDGKGRGEMLHLLFEKGLLIGDKPAIELNGTDFCGATLDKAHLDGIFLVKVDLTNSKMDGAHLSKSRLSGINLSKAFLRHADLREAMLAGGNLYGAHLEGANLENADLSCACLVGAFLMNANLKNCTLNGILVRDAHFKNVDLRGCQGCNAEILDQAVLIETILPDGRKVTNAKGKEYLRKKEFESLVDKL